MTDIEKRKLEDKVCEFIIKTHPDIMINFTGSIEPDFWSADCKVFGFDGEKFFEIERSDEEYCHVVYPPDQDEPKIDTFFDSGFSKTYIESRQSLFYLIIHHSAFATAHKNF